MKLGVSYNAKNIFGVRQCFYAETTNDELINIYAPTLPRHMGVIVDVNAFVQTVQLTMNNDSITCFYESIDNLNNKILTINHQWGYNSKTHKVPLKEAMTIIKGYLNGVTIKED